METHTHHLDDKSLLSNYQFGFRSGRSTSNLLMLLYRDWQDPLDNGLDILVIALDIAGAFDRVWHADLLEKLRVKDIQGHLFMLMGDYLHDRLLHVVVNWQQSRNLPVGASVPQGSVLGPISGTYTLTTFSGPCQQSPRMPTTAHSLSLILAMTASEQLLMSISNCKQ